VREMRICLGLSQQEFSQQVGIKRERLASYEDARAPLKTLLALQMCNQFIVSERWLASGTGYFGERKSEIVPFSQPMARMCMNLVEGMEASNIKPNKLFSGAYDEILESRYLALWDKNGLFPRIKFSVSDDIGRLRNILQFVTTSWIGIGCDEEKKRLLHGIIRAGCLLADEVAKAPVKSSPTAFELLLDEAEKREVERWEEDIARLAAEHPELSDVLGIIPAEKGLTKITYNGNISIVTPRLPTLLKRLNEATRARGTKTALAKFMGVPLPKISQWLSGTYEPGGETTLRLLHWVEQQERQK